MIEAYLRKRIQPIFNILGTRLCIPLQLSPNFITSIAFLCGIFAGIFIALNKLSYALFFLIFSGLCDIMDGTVARITNSSHPLGAYIDLISDRMVEVSLIIGFTFLYPEYYLAYIVFLSSVLLHFSTFVTAGALFDNHGTKSMYHDHSLIERAEAFVIFGLMMLLPQHIFFLLIIFSLFIFFDGATRFYRIVKLKGYSP